MASSIDPLMMGVIAQCFQALNTSSWFTIGMTFGITAVILNLSLLINDVALWRHARNLQVTDTTLAGAASIAFFITALQTRFTVSGAMYVINTVSFDNVVATRGALLEVFLWIIWAIWLLSSGCCFYLRIWEIRQTKSMKNTTERSPESSNDDTMTIGGTRPAAMPPTVPMLRSLTDESISDERRGGRGERVTAEEGQAENAVLEQIAAAQM